MLETLTIPEVAAVLRVCVRTVKGEIAAGRLVPSKVGRLARFTPRDIEEYLERTKVAKKPAAKVQRRQIPDLLNQPAAVAFAACSRK